MGDYHCEDSGTEYCLLKELFPSDRIESIDASESKGHVIGQGALEDISDGCDINCIRKQIAAKLYNRRQIEQLRCIADYKYILGEKENQDIEFEEAGTMWVVNGFAEVFAKVYSEKKSKQEIIRHWNLYIDSEKKLNGR